MVRLLALMLPGLVAAGIGNRTFSNLDESGETSFGANYTTRGRRLIEVFVKDTHINDNRQVSQITRQRLNELPHSLRETCACIMIFSLVRFAPPLEPNSTLLERRRRCGVILCTTGPQILQSYGMTQSGNGGCFTRNGARKAAKICRAFRGLTEQPLAWPPRAISV